MRKTMSKDSTSLSNEALRAGDLLSVAKYNRAMINYYSVVALANAIDQQYPHLRADIAAQEAGIPAKIKIPEAALIEITETDLMPKYPPTNEGPVDPGILTAQDIAVMASGGFGQVESDQQNRIAAALKSADEAHGAA
jgi:hypothetical protein